MQANESSRQLGLCVICGATAVALALMLTIAGRSMARNIRELRVCADPNNLPFSNRQGQGFENALARLVAKELGATLQYTWWAQRRGFLRNTLNAERCDVVMGVPTGLGMLRTTTPYYSARYAFVTRAARRLALSSFDDPALSRLRIGVQLVGDDYANPPPAAALARRNLIDNVFGYTLYGDYAQPNPAARIVDAVRNGDIDVAVVWGPLAGYFVKTSRDRAASKLALAPVAAREDAGIPLEYSISMGVRKRDAVLHAELQRIIAQRRASIERVLLDFGVPYRAGTTQRGAR
jgi:mxaJ protein